ncbi:helix-turn-helix transcriptional regulator [Paenibacillus tengchongensis]|uniref:helix-turn-helix transcriptional regulator n=1 Tax=Paenibacillus tengchongensis TaxID=2608684 RepID=UPI00124D07AF|nr:helix-turn-helix domain-containing protein [Paenibacillus tengchongensis]
MQEFGYNLNDLIVHIHFVLDKVTYPGWEDIRNLVNVHSLYWIHEGEGTFLTNLEHQVQAGMLVYLKPGLHMSMRSESSAPLRITMLLFDCAELVYDAVWQNVLPVGKLALPFISQFHGSEAEELSERFREFHQEWSPGLPAGTAVSKAKLQLLLHKLHRSAQADWSLMESGAFAAFEQIKKQLENSAKENLRIEQLAEQYSISASYLRKLFLKYTGMGPKEYHMHFRNQHACGYLVYTDYPVKEIARLCGFYEEYHFSKMFKQLNGLSPSAYRRSRRVEE